MNNQERFEELMSIAADRPGWSELMNYIQKSDFYTAPASSRFHLSCAGGLLQHSLNVYDALVGRLVDTVETDEMALQVSGHTVAAFKKETLAIAALLHDLCKTNFYTVEYRNQKTYDKEKVAKANPYQVKKRQRWPVHLGASAVLCNKRQEPIRPRREVSHDGGGIHEADHGRKVCHQMAHGNGQCER